jgi:hypothetical protein
MADGNIQAARTKLARAVQRLTAPRNAHFLDNVRIAPSLYTQLVSDLAGTQGDTRTPAKSLPPLWIDACQLIVDMDRTTAKWANGQFNDTPHRLQALSFAATWRPQDTHHVNTIATTVDSWCDKIINLLDPQSRKEITAPCPSCGKRVVYRKDPAGELVRQAALVLIVGQGCTCLSCDAHWSPDYYMHLARLLKCDLPAGVLE